MKLGIPNKKIVSVIVLTVLTAMVIIFAKDSYRRTQYDLSAPTIEKYALIKNFIPTDSDFIAVADAARFDLSSSLAAIFKDAFLEKDSLGIFSSFLAGQKQIGMIAAAVTLGSAGEASQICIVIHGSINPQELIKKIESELALKRGALTTKVHQGETLYLAKLDGTDFAFSFPDSRHLVAGDISKVENALDKTAQKSKMGSVDSAFFGEISFSKRFKDVFPPQFGSIAPAKFFMNGPSNLKIEIECQSDKLANELSVFLSGMKALYVLSKETDENLSGTLNKTGIQVDKNKVSIDLPLS